MSEKDRRDADNLAYLDPSRAESHSPRLSRRWPVDLRHHLRRAARWTGRGAARVEWRIQRSAHPCAREADASRLRSAHPGRRRARERRDAGRANVAAEGPEASAREVHLVGGGAVKPGAGDGGRRERCLPPAVPCVLGGAWGGAVDVTAGVRPHVPPRVHERLARLATGKQAGRRLSLLQARGLRPGDQVRGTASRG